MCISSADGAKRSDCTVNQMDEKLSNIVAAVEGINRRLGDLEARTGFTRDSGSVSFADVIKKTISDVKRSEEPDMRVRDHGRTRVCVCGWSHKRPQGHPS